VTAPLALLGAPPVRTRPYPPWPVAPAAAVAGLTEVLRSGVWWQSGDGAAERLERALAGWFGVERVVAVSNGTVALEVALRALRVGPGHEVLVPATTFISTASALAAVGARPVPVDISANTYNIDVGAAARLLSPHTRALIVVHLAGQPADLVAARSLCDRHGLLLVEDSAQAIAAEWDGIRVGTAGDVATLSFQAAKLLAGGEGRAVLVPHDSALAHRVELLSNCGRPRGHGGYEHSVLGSNARISEFNAAVVAAQIADYPRLARARAAGAAMAVRALPADIPVETDAAVTRRDWYMLILRTPAELRAAGIGNSLLAAALTAEGIPAKVLFPAWSTLPAFAGHDLARYHCPRAAVAAAGGICIHHRMLTDPGFAGDLATAWSRLLRASDRLRTLARDGPPTGVVLPAATTNAAATERASGNG
jgi:3-amino-5-hydroxybenzoate synthase